MEYRVGQRFVSNSNEVKYDLKARNRRLFKEEYDKGYDKARQTIQSLIKTPSIVSFIFFYDADTDYKRLFEDLGCQYINTHFSYYNWDYHTDSVSVEVSHLDSINATADVKSTYTIYGDGYVSANHDIKTNVRMEYSSDNSSIDWLIIDGYTRYGHDVRTGYYIFDTTKISKPDMSKKINKLWEYYVKYHSFINGWLDAEKETKRGGFYRPASVISLSLYILLLILFYISCALWPKFLGTTICGLAVANSIFGLACYPKIVDRGNGLIGTGVMEIIASVAVFAMSIIAENGWWFEWELNVLGGILSFVIHGAAIGVAIAVGLFIYWVLMGEAGDTKDSVYGEQRNFAKEYLKFGGMKQYQLLLNDVKKYIVR